MAIDAIRLQNFRSYIDASFEFEPGVNIIVGPNASGKTNLLEAVLVLASGKSFKSKDAELVRHEKPWARLDGFFGKQARVMKLSIKQDALIKNLSIDSKDYRRLRLEHTVPVVIFEPNHLQLITRGPDQRREYIDDLLERTQPAFKSLSANYRRSLAQRNALLKQGHSKAVSQMFAWDVRLSELGSKIAEARTNLIDDINQVISRDYGRIAGREAKVELNYDSHFPIDRYATKFLSKLEDSANLDMMRGFTAYGPHREDIVFYLKGQPVGPTASRGETRSIMLALKIFELGLLEKTRGQKPILLLDDVFSELDGARRRLLVEHLKDHQTIITTTDADAVIEYFSDQHNLIPLG